MSEPPRPAGDTGIGFCYFPDEDHYRPSDLERWLPELRALGASWLVLRTERPAPVPEAFVRGLLAEGIEPVLHLYAETLERYEAGPLRRTAERYAAWGAHYLCVYDQPNVRACWGSAWGRPQLVERFVDLALPALQAVEAAGLVPVLAPPAPAGQYWDLTFLAALLDSLKRRAPVVVVERLAIGMHNYADDRPLNWGAGGPAAWPQAQPYFTPPGSEDHLGFRLYEWYDAIVRAHLGASRPLVSLGDGLRLGESAGAGPAVDRNLHANGHVAIAEQFASGAVPYGVLNSAFWVLAAAPSDPAAPQAWFHDGRPRTPAAQALRARGRRPRPVPIGAPPVAAPAPAHVAHTAPNVAGKLMRHYVLLPVFEWGPSEWHWLAAQRYVQSVRASCGFCPDEARLAENVTIVGNTQGISQEVETRLRACGCTVTRVSGASGEETLALLNQLAQADQDKEHSA
jgi:hypothetical protein